MARLGWFVVRSIMAKWRPGMRVVVESHKEERRVVPAAEWWPEYIRTLRNVANPSEVFSPFCGCSICSHIRAGTPLFAHIPPGLWVQ